MYSVCKAICVLAFSILIAGCSLINDPASDETVVCLTFDDQHISIWQHAVPLMRQYGFRGTLYVNSGRVGNLDRMTWEQIETLTLAEGWETGGHTLNHENLPTLSYAEAQDAIDSDWDLLVQHGLNPRSFSLPGGSCPTEYFPIITNRYRFIRGSNDYAMYKPYNKLGLGYLPYQNTWTANQIKDRIVRGIAAKENLIVIGFHRFETDPQVFPDTITASVFEEILQWISAKGIRVLTLSEAMEE